MKILVSACLLGRNCKYDGGNNFRQNVVDLLRGHEVVEVCPEVMAGRSIPRKPIELLNGKFIEEDGTDVDVQVQRGVGSSTNGDGAFGGTIALGTRAPSLVPTAYNSVLTWTERKIMRRMSRR